MGKNAYVGVSSIAKKVKNMYVGVGGVAKKVKKAYIGVGGVAKEFWSESGGAITNVWWENSVDTTSTNYKIRHTSDNFDSVDSEEIAISGLNLQTSLMTANEFYYIDGCLYFAASGTNSGLYKLELGKSSTPTRVHTYYDIAGIVGKKIILMQKTAYDNRSNGSTLSIVVYDTTTGTYKATAFGYKQSTGLRFTNIPDGGDEGSNNFIYAKGFEPLSNSTFKMYWQCDGADAYGTYIGYGVYINTFTISSSNTLTVAYNTFVNHGSDAEEKCTYNFGISSYTRAADYGSGTKQRQMYFYGSTQLRFGNSTEIGPTNSRIFKDKTYYYIHMAPGYSTNYHSLYRSSNITGTWTIVNYSSMTDTGMQNFSYDGKYFYTQSSYKIYRASTFGTWTIVRSPIRASAYGIGPSALTAIGTYDQ